LREACDTLKKEKIRAEGENENRFVRAEEGRD
jgi:hypothetical protein